MKRAKRINRKLKLLYHETMMRLYGKLADSVEDDPENKFGELVYLRYFTKYILHKEKVRELKGA